VDRGCKRRGGERRLNAAFNYDTESLQYLHAVVAAVGGDDATAAVDGHGARAVELAGGAAHAADRAHVRAVGVAQDLDAVVVPVGHYDVATVIKRNSNRTFEFSGCSAFTAYAAQECAVAVSNYLQRAIRI
jgi:hypothetical protein